MKTDKKTSLRESPVQAVLIEYACGECDGSMKATKFQCYIDGVQHQCDKCGCVAVLDRAYPYVAHREDHPA